MHIAKTAGAFVTISILFLLLFTSFVEAQSPVVSNPVRRYIGALQKHDFKTVIDLTYVYQQEVARIKAANPRVLWPRLVTEYYTNKESTFRQQVGTWQNYFEAVGATMGDPTQSIRALQSLVSPSCRWTITESRTDQVRDAFRSYQRTRVYLTISYPSPTDAPLTEQQLIKQTILEFAVNAKSHLIMAMTEVPQGRMYWTAGPPDVHMAMARRFVAAKLWNRSIAELEPLEQTGQLSPDGKGLLAQAYFQTACQRCLSYPLRVQDCAPTIRHAAKLDPTSATMWAQKLLALSRDMFNQEIHSPFPARSKKFDYSESLVKNASEFIGRDQQLRTETDNLRADIGRQYVAKAMDGYGFDVFGRVDGEAEALEALSKAKELYPDVLRDREVLTAAKGKIRKAVAGFESSITNKYDVTNTIGFLVAFGISIPSEDLTEFRDWAKYTTDPPDAGGPAKWSRAIEQLANNH